MSLKIKIAARLKAKAAGVNLSQKRIDAIVIRAEKGLTDESDDAAIDANLDTINELTPFKEIAALDDHERARTAKEKADKETARLKAIEEGKTPEPEPDPNESSTDKLLKALMAKLDKQNQEIASIKGEKVTTTRREQFIKAMAGTPKEYQARELKRFDRISFKDDEDFNTFLEDTKEDHAAAIQEDANSDLGKDRPVGGKGGDTAKTKLASDTELDAVMENL
ncbi:hypothetical protein SAMN05421821_105138 [Mucilaginibacter lappiensis]|uniref:Uncharacterized protein n=1 Tax=Mucilaginibacter lappiensis TaxID=354630 RepID=A0ABR6PJ06_9SPHI|nr:hypothetical protein [Mucilaginibacter lappiensis]MBB6109720.1 hypothetical protein [Mucilaginibacter lappiensis]SIR13080.1 hypothetical protein SAMN05421821_105138 [Mucilaginibacter lappiensis]